MKKLSIVGMTALLTAIAAIGCGDDDSDNPGQSTAGKNAGGETGESGSSTGGKNAGGKNAGGKSSGGSATVDGGSDNSPAAGAGGADVGASCTDVYAERPEGRKEIPHDDEGNITTDHLTSDTIWTLAGRWFVKPGHTLTIDPCTLIEATGKPNAGALFVPQDAKIHAVGTPNAPIVFTTESHEFEDGAPWGGLMLLGKAPVARLNDTPGYTRTFEGYNDPRTTFGMEDPADFDAEDSSGEVQYVRIEFGGDIIVGDKEINGMTFCGVGSGTTIDHVMVKDQADDCFEFFGGTVNVSHLICQNSGDDMFDTDLGYRGNMQFLFGRNLIEGTSGDPNGFEWDGNQDFLPSPDDETSRPQVSNVTLCGLNDAGVATSNGAVIRRSISEGTSILNTIFTGFDNGLDLRNAVGTNEAPFVSITNSLFFGQLKSDGQSATDDDTSPADAGSKDLKGDSGFIENDYLNDAANAVTLGGDAPEGFDCYAETPVAPTEPVEGATPGSGFDESAEFVGAGDFSADGWESGSWIEWK
ncbi:MAG: hypothetical protein EOO73_14245 [Myxococcales bacterium]|nr:MAG: hypothetical protein EOO73_14245 [Myxococcales bacterium]